MRYKKNKSSMLIVSIFFWGLILILYSSTGFSQDRLGRVSGKVLDAKTQEELIGASVVVQGKNIGQKTDIHGVYSLDLEPGNYTIRISFIGYVSLVEKISIRSLETLKKDLFIRSNDVEVDEIIVKAKIGSATENATLMRRKNAYGISDAVSAEAIKRTPDSNAGESIKRSTGVSILGGKYVMIRGLGERYSATLLNGLSMPSPEPEKKAFPFDLFPSSIVDNITTIKTFLPDQLGTFSGGIVNINTRDFPEKNSFIIRLSAGINTSTQFQSQLGHQGGSLDFLAIDDGTRNVLSDIPSFFSNGALYASKFSDIWEITPSYYSLPSINAGITYTGKFDIGIPIGATFSLLYGQKANHKASNVFYPTANGQADYDYMEDAMTREYQWGGILNLSTNLAEDHILSLKTTYNRSAEDESLVAKGIAQRIDGDSLISTRIKYVERDIFSLQFLGEHGLPMQSLLEWSGQFAYASRLEPDNRQTTYAKREGQDRFRAMVSGNRRFFSQNRDLKGDARVDWKIPIKLSVNQEISIKTGVLFGYKTRSFSARRFRYEPREAFSENLPNSLFSAAGIEEKFSLRDDTQPTDKYIAQEITNAFYIMAEAPLVRKLRLVGGVRLERNLMMLDFTSDVGKAGKAGFDNWNVLPSLNFIYALADDMNLRLVYTRTVALPEFRELAPFRFDDYRTSVFGNPYLTQSYINNVDLRWEWFTGTAEVIAVSAFFKHFESPFEKVSFPSSSSGVVFTNINAESGYCVGIELEVRKSLAFISSLLEDLSIGFNTTVMMSRIVLPQNAPYLSGGIEESLSSDNYVDTQRSMQGQSPYVINAGLYYTSTRLGLSASLAYNIVGDRITQVGIKPGESSFVIGNTIELPRHQLDFVITKSFGGATLKFSAKNILDSQYLFVVESEGITSKTEAFFLGRTLALSFSYTL